MKYYIHTFGCQMNVRDSEEMGQTLEAEGYTRAPSPEDADLILVNTCTVRQKAVHKGVSAIGRYIYLKGKRPDLVVGACGCYAQQAGSELLQEAKGVDLIIGPDAKHKVAELAAERRRIKKPVISTCLEGDEHLSDTTALPRNTSGLSALVTIMKGCDNFCSFCVVPHVRGREVSRSPTDILAEIERLALSGTREVTLLGQNVNSYGARLSNVSGAEACSKGSKSTGGADFPALLRLIFEVEGIERVRFTTSHPKDLSESLAACFTHRKLMPHIHLPVQAGSDAVLERMSRKYTRADYLGKAALIRKYNPDVAVTTDIIVGFPGETEKDFEATMSLVEEVGFDGAFSFKYSPRPGTAAESMKDDVSPKEKSRRLALLQDLVQKIAFEKSAGLVGKKMAVLVEGIGRHKGQKCGRTPCNRVVNFSGEQYRVGDIVEVEVTEALPHSLLGKASRLISGCSGKRVEPSRRDV